MADVQVQARGIGGLTTFVAKQHVFSDIGHLAAGCVLLADRIAVAGFWPETLFQTGEMVAHGVGFVGKVVLGLVHAVANGAAWFRVDVVAAAAAEFLPQALLRVAGLGDQAVLGRAEFVDARVDCVFQLLAI
ncbi:hypothetical protein D3C77_177920 [compost metagenome]